MTIGMLITKSALGTVSYYMMEFHDEVNEQWMMGYNNYKKSGYQFPNGDWTIYIENMIKTDRLQIEVRVPASKATRKARGIPEGSNIVMQYVHELGTVLLFYGTVHFYLKLHCIALTEMFYF
jgi:hypothetical protein